MAKQPLRVILAQPRGFCAGVVRAVDIVERALEIYGAPVYVRHEIVHNKHVVDGLREKGAIFVEKVSDIPTGAVTVFSAHGVSRKVEDAADGRGLQVIDATCPLVSKVHVEAQRYARQDYEVVLIGHAGHPEVEGTMGQVPGTVHLVSDLADVTALEPADPAKLAYVTQTTLSVDDTREIIGALKARFPRGAWPRREGHLLRDAEPADRGASIGGRVRRDPGHWRRLQLQLQPAAGDRRRSGNRQPPHSGCRGLDPAWLDGANTVGITAGASAPEELVQGLVDRLCDMFDVTLTDLDGIEENVTFKLPRELTGAQESAL